MRDDVTAGILLIMVSTVPHAQDNPMFYLGAAMAVACGMILRIGLSINNKTFSWNGLMVQCLVTFPVCYFAYYLYIDLGLTYTIQNYLFVISVFALTIASVFDGIGKIGIKQYARYLLGKVLADTKEKEDGHV